MKMPLLLLLAVAMSDFPGFQSARVKSGRAGAVQVSGHLDGAAVDAKELLSCLIGDTETKIIIRSEDHGFWDYYYTKEDFYTSYRDGKVTPFTCKPHTLPLKAAYALSNLTNPPLSEDIIRLIAGFNSSPERCRLCHGLVFTPKFLGKCSAPSIEGPREERRQRFEMVQKEAHEEGGSCSVRLSSSAKVLPLDVCMGDGVTRERSDIPYFKNAKRFGACYVL